MPVWARTPHHVEPVAPPRATLARRGPRRQAAHSDALGRLLRRRMALPFLAPRRPCPLDTGVPLAPRLAQEHWLTMAVVPLRATLPDQLINLAAATSPAARDRILISGDPAILPASRPPLTARPTRHANRSPAARARPRLLGPPDTRQTTTAQQPRPHYTLRTRGC
jgi:hypothetical protein